MFERIDEAGLRPLRNNLFEVKLIDLPTSGVYPLPVNHTIAKELRWYHQDIG
jgi:hypothetical protein